MIQISRNHVEIQRRSMVESQLIPRGIKDKAVLDAFYTVPRELFVSEKRFNEAYNDNPLPLMSGQTISQPYIVALMTELLELPIDRSARILEIGTGSGYQSAIIASMGHKVVSVERLEDLAEFAIANLKNVPYGENVTVVVGDGSLGWPEQAPYDGILVAAAAPEVPPPLVKQLKVDAKLVIPCGERFIQEMLQIIKISSDGIKTNRNCGCRFVPLIGKNGFSK